MLPDKLGICKKTRKIAADAFFISLRELLSSGNPVSEINLRDRWLRELRKNKDIFPDGWYTPPPYGIIVLFADDINVDRVTLESARPAHMWPQKDRILDRERGIIMVYASPTDRLSGMIGDFSLTLYLGNNKSVKKHLESTLELCREVFNKVEVGMKFSKLATIAKELMDKRGLYNSIISSTDPAGTNIGHTFPFSYEDMNKEEAVTFRSGRWESVKDMISAKRRFVNQTEDLEIKPGMAFTIEPRVQAKNDPKMPMACFHTVCLVYEDGEKELLEDFERFFNIS